MYSYENEIFDNYKSLAATYPNVAAELLDEFGEGKWQDSDLYYYPSENDFAIYEIVDGWYSTIQLDTDFNGAPNLLDFIDFEGLGRALVETWDASCNFETKSGEIVTTSYGW